ncbi:MAG: hypothetical protein AB1832_07570 [Pseudomonadota bacterium]
MTATIVRAKIRLGESSGPWRLLATLCLVLAIGTLARAAELRPVPGHPKLAEALSWGTRLAETDPVADQPDFVRLWAVPMTIDECSGTVDSCPDVRLYIALTSGDLGDRPTLYELPPAKGWAFLGWDKPPSPNIAGNTRFSIATALPDDQISDTARAHWKPTVYRVTVNLERGTFTTETAGSGARP